MITAVQSRRDQTIEAGDDVAAKGTSDRMVNHGAWFSVRIDGHMTKSGSPDRV